MADMLVRGGERPLRGILPAPPHRDLAQMALLAASLTAGETEVRGRGIGPLPISAALSALGVPIERSAMGYVVRGVGLDGFHAPRAPLAAGASWTALALLSGLVTSLPFAAVIHCDEAVGRRNLEAIARVLRKRGGQLEGRFVEDAPGVLLPPLAIEASPPLSGLAAHPIAPGAHAEKLAALASGLLAEESTTLLEPVVGGDLFVRLLRELGVAIETVGGLTRVAPLGGPLEAGAMAIPGDPDTSLMLLAAAMAVPESHVGVRGMVSQPSDAGALDALLHGGAGLIVEARSTVLGQATADISCNAYPPRSVDLSDERAFAAGAGLPTLAAWAAHARADSVIAGVPPDSAHPDQGRRVTRILAAFGVPAHWSEGTGTLRVTGGALGHQDVTRSELVMTVPCEGDGACAMLAAVLGLAAGGTTLVPDADCIVARFPRFVGSLRALGASIEVRGEPAVSEESTASAS